MAKINATKSVLFVNTGTTASPEWKIIQCQLSTKLDSSRDEQDADSKCGPDVSLSDAKTNATVEGYAIKSDTTTTNQVTFKEWDDMYQGGLEHEFMQVPKTSSTTTTVGDEGDPKVTFRAKITSASYDFTNKEYVKFTSSLSLTGAYQISELV